MIKFYNSLKPLHLFLFATAFLLLARTVKGNFGTEMGCLLASLFTYVLALIKYVKDKKNTR